MKHVKPCAALCAILLLAACSAEPPPPKGVKIGKPYEIDGTTYYPAHEPTYDKTGDGSWYGPGFHGKRTASGEKFNENDLTAAHPTLPMPSLVRVTNLKNDQSVIVRINDRGPFKKNRIIDLSKKSAETIGLHSTMPVRVQFLKQETEAYVEAMKNGGEREIDMFAYNENYDAGRASFASNSAPREVEIVENARVENDLSDTANVGVASVAPVTSITSSDLSAPGSKPVTSKSLPAPKTKPVTLKKAWADDNVSLPEPPSDEGDVVDLTQSMPQEHVLKKPEPAKAVVKTENKKTDEKAVGKYLVLAGSYSSEANAKKLAKTLNSVSSVKIPTKVDKLNVNGKTLWRVHAGPFSKESDAQRALAITQKSGAPDARIAKQ